MFPGEDVDNIPEYRDGLVKKWFETRDHITPGMLDKGKRYIIQFTPRELTWQGGYEHRDPYTRGFFTYLGFKIDTSRKQENDPRRSASDKKSMRQYRFVDGKGVEFSLYQAAQYAGTTWEQNAGSSKMVISVYPVEPKYVNGNEAREPA